MSLTVTTKTTSPYLVTLAELKTRLGISGLGEDSELQGFSRAVTAVFETYLGRPLLRQTYLEGASGHDRLRLVLQCRPVDPQSVTVEIDDSANTDFVVEDWRQGTLYLEGLFGSTGTATGQDGKENVEVTYKAGYVPPELMAAWSSGSKSLGEWTKPTTLSDSPLLFEVTTAGTTGGTEPTWSTTPGATVTDGTVTWTARRAEEVPLDLQEAALLQVMSWYRGEGQAPPSGVKRERRGGHEIEYFAPGDLVQSASHLSRPVLAILGGYL